MRYFAPLLLAAAVTTVPFLTVSHVGVARVAAATTEPTELTPAEKAHRVAEIPSLQADLKEATAMRDSLSKDFKDPMGFRHTAVNDLNDAIRNLNDMIKEYQGDETTSK